MIKSLNTTTAGEVSEIFQEFKNSGLLFQCDFSQISKHFLWRFLSVEPFKINYKNLVKAYIENIEFDESKKKKNESKKKRLEEIYKVAKDELTFHKYICETYLGLIKEPKEELLNAFVIANRDIIDIDNTLTDILKELDQITTSNKALEIQQRKPILYYYQERNNKAKEEILTFLKNEIYDYAISKCYDNSLFGSFMSGAPYSYAWNRKAYKPKEPNDLENKFSELPILEFKTVNKKYKDDKKEFYKYLSQYIEEEGIAFSILNILDKHHLLDARKEIITEAINTFQHGAKIMFANAVPTIIEGILHDLCVIIGINENELLQKGFQFKLDALQQTFSYELYYEYYSFRFRIFRNKVAHGRLTKADVDELADLLILDLYQICKLTYSTKLKLNQKRFVIEELNKNPVSIDYKYVLEYLLLDPEPIPAFYGLNKQIKNVEKIIASTNFWKFLEDELDSSDYKRHGIYIILKTLSNRKTFDNQCKKLFKKLGIKNVNKELANKYISHLTNYY